MYKKSIFLYFTKAAIVLFATITFCFFFVWFDSTQTSEKPFVFAAQDELQGGSQKILKESGELIASSGGVEAHGQLTVKKGRLLDKYGEPVVLRGISSHGIAWYPEYTNYQALKTVRNYGANVFRIAMYVAQNDGYLEEPELNKKLLFAAIENSLAADLYTIVDWHVLRDKNPNYNVKEAISLLGEVAQRYGDNPGIIYEICNEPNGDTAYNEIVHYADQVIPAIRKYAPNAVILVGTPKFCTSLSEAIANPIQHENIMYTYHYYAGLSDCMYAIKEISRGIQHNLPVFVSEWGVNTYDATEKHWKNTKAFVDFLEQENISWVNWSLSNKDEGYSMIKSDCTKLHGWGLDELSESGRFVLQYLLTIKE